MYIWFVLNLFFFLHQSLGWWDMWLKLNEIINIIKEYNSWGLVHTAQGYFSVVTEKWRHIL